MIILIGTNHLMTKEEIYDIIKKEKKMIQLQVKYQML